MRGLAIGLFLVVGAGCRRGPTTVNYVGPPVSTCSAGRAYAPPPAGSEHAVALVPVTAIDPETAPADLAPAEVPPADVLAPTPAATDPAPPAEPKKPANRKHHAKKGGAK